MNCAGIEVEGITVEQKREILKAQIELEAARRELELLRAQVGDYEAMRGLFQSECVAREKEAAALQKQIEILTERQAESDALIKELVRVTKRNRIESALSNPVMTLAFKLAVPLGNLIIGGLK